MAFWNDFSQKVSGTTAKAVQKAKEMTDVVKLNALISEEEKNLNRIYCQIGKLYVSMHANDHQKDEFSDMFEMVSAAEKKIEGYRQKIQEIKQIETCPECGAEVQAGSAFCSSCGARMPEVQTDAEEYERCEACGTMVKKGSRFCTACGKPMHQEGNFAKTEPETAEKAGTEEDLEKNKAAEEKI